MDGSNRRAITPNSGSSYNFAAPSPDGSRLAFQRWHVRGRMMGIYQLRLGADPEQRVSPWSWRAGRRTGPLMVKGSSSPATFSETVRTERFTPSGRTGMPSSSSLTLNSPSKIGLRPSLRPGSASCSLPIADIPTAAVCCSRCVSMNRIDLMLAREENAQKYGSSRPAGVHRQPSAGNHPLAPRDFNERVSDDRRREFQQLLGDRGAPPRQDARRPCATCAESSPC